MAERPLEFKDFIGQERVKGQLRIAIQSAKQRNAVLDHIFLSGPPGVGKTTLARIVAHQMGVRLFEVISTVIKKPADILQTLVQLRRGDMLFIDEVHSLPGNVQEFLYSAMEDYQISTASNLASRRVIQVPLNPFVLIGATTIEGSINSPLLQRFGIHCQLEQYTLNDMQIIVTNACKGHLITKEAILIIAQRSRSTPRIALRHLRRSIDTAAVQNKKAIDAQSVLSAYDTMGVTEYGLTYGDLSVLKALIEAGRQVGVEQIAAMTNISRETVEYSIEPHLLRLGFIRRMPRGREITQSGKDAWLRLKKLL